MSSFPFKKFSCIYAFHGVESKVFFFCRFNDFYKQNLLFFVTRLKKSSSEDFSMMNLLFVVLKYVT